MLGKQWSLFIDDDGDPHMIINDGGKLRPATKPECERAIGILNEEGQNIIRIHCRNDACKDKGSWIERTRMDVSKMTYHCEVCGKPMER